MNQQPKASKPKTSQISGENRSGSADRLEHFERLLEKLGAPKPRLTRRDLPSNYPRVH